MPLSFTREGRSCSLRQVSEPVCGRLSCDYVHQVAMRSGYGTTVGCMISPAAWCGADSYANCSYASDIWLESLPQHTVDRLLSKAPSQLQKKNPLQVEPYRDGKYIFRRQYCYALLSPALPPRRTLRSPFRGKKSYPLSKPHWHASAHCTHTSPFFTLKLANNRYV
jgi:hypothetical protein